MIKDTKQKTRGIKTRAIRGLKIRYRKTREKVWKNGKMKGEKRTVKKAEKKCEGETG